jgi:hypothetical protein
MLTAEQQTIRSQRNQREIGKGRTGHSKNCLAWIPSISWKRSFLGPTNVPKRETTLCLKIPMTKQTQETTQIINPMKIKCPTKG